MEPISNNGTFGTDVNEVVVLDHIEKLLGIRERHENESHTDVINIDDDDDEKDVKTDNDEEEEPKDFVPGDVVWVLRNTNEWWPGMISEPTSSSSKGYKNFIHNKDYLFIKLFSCTFSVWVSKSRIKEFISCFDEMVNQKEDSRAFLAAVEKGVNEISSHVKKELTCSCFLDKPCPPKVLLDLKSFALSRFQPDKFLSHIKDIAIDGVVSPRVMITVTRDCVSSFYRSLGHPQLQVHQLMTPDPYLKASRKRSRNETQWSSKEMADELRLAAVDGPFNKVYRSPVCSLKRVFSCWRRFSFLKREEEKPKEDNALQLALMPPPPPKVFAPLLENRSLLMRMPPPPGFSPQRESGLQLVAMPPPSASPLNLMEYMKRELRAMESRLEKEGHLLSPETREHLVNEIRGLKEKYSSLFGSSSS